MNVSVFLKKSTLDCENAWGVGGKKHANKTKTTAKYVVGFVLIFFVYFSKPSQPLSLRPAAVVLRGVQHGVHRGAGRL